jgi:hypothetical protein
MIENRAEKCLYKKYFKGYPTILLLFSSSSLSLHSSTVGFLEELHASEQT